jgi:hypothetical protein
MLFFQPFFKQFIFLFMDQYSQFHPHLNPIHLKYHHHILDYQILNYI